MKRYLNQYTLMAAIGAAFAVMNIYRTFCDGKTALCVLFVIMLLGAIGFGLTVTDEPESERQQKEIP